MATHDSDTNKTPFPVPFGRYTLLGVLGEGGMARVFRAELRGPSDFRKAVAVKVVRAELADDRLRASLLREARIGGLLKHPNIVDIYDFGEVGDQPWIAMELVEGTDLAAWLSQLGPPPPEIVLEIAIAICSGLEEAHDLAEHGRPANLIHRDLKPSNVLLSRLGEVKVMDFGIAQASGIVDGTTRTGMVRGTPRYLSPEQALAEPLDRRSDIFSLGLLMYELAMGEPFLDQPTVTSVVAALLDIESHTASPGRLGMLEECAPGLSAVVRRCLRRDPSARYGDTRELRAALESLRATLGTGRHTLREYVGPRVERLWSAAEPSSSAPSLSSLGIRASTEVPSRRWGLIAAALAVAVLALALVWAGLRSGDPEPVGQASRSEGAAPRVHTRVLVRGETDVSEPSLSPDGSQVVYLRRVEGGSELVIRVLDSGAERVLSREPGVFRAQPTFSPDGTRVAFSRSPGLYTMPLDGGEAQRITDSGVHPDWSPDGSRIAFTTEPIHAPQFKTTVSALWVVDVESRRTRKIFDGDANMADWAPGGERIAFWSALPDGSRRVFTIAADGGEPVSVTAGEALDWNPRWSPDGRRLYFFSDRSGASALWRVAIDEESGRPLGAPEPLTTGGTATPGFLSTDRAGARWVYQTSDAEQNLFVVPLLPLDGSAPREPVQVTRGVRRLQAAAISPDGSRIAFVEQTDQEDVYVANADGSDPVRLTDDPHRDREVAWSPDGSRIAFYSNRDGTYRVWTIRPDGSDLRVATPDSDARYPIWAPDGKRLAVSDHPGGTASIVHLDADGAPSRREQIFLPRLETGLYSPTSWSPDGRRILFTWHRDESDLVLVYDVETGEHAPLEVPGTTSAMWLDDDTLLARQREPSRFVQVEWPDGDPVPRHLLADDTELWWWLTTPDAQNLLLVLHDDRTGIWGLDID